MSDRKPIESYDLWVLVRADGENKGRPMIPMDGTAHKDQGFIVYRSLTAVSFALYYQHQLHADLRWEPCRLCDLDPKWLAPVVEVQG